MDKEYIYINYEFDGNVNLFADIDKIENAKCISVKKKEYDNIFLKIISKIHLSEKLHKFIHFPFREIWFTNLSKMKIEKDKNYVIMVQAVVFWKIPFSMIAKYAKYKNVKLVLILMDSIGVKSPAGEIIEVMRKKPIWDYIFTFDLGDANKYGYYYLNEHYYPMPKVEKVDDITTDAYLIAALKDGRNVEMVDLYERFIKNGVNVWFDVVENQGRTLDYSNKSFNMLKKKKTYEEVLKEVVKTNCIIEFLQKGQEAQTLRYFEAVCFNKKLLTNNPNVKNLKFYNENYMKVFNTFDDIDFDWVKTKENIDYHYNGEFSPIYFMKELQKIEQEHEIEKKSETEI